MAEFVCRLGTPAGEVVTRTIEAAGVTEARARLEREGFKVFNVTPPKATGVTNLTRFGGRGAQAKVKANDFLLFNQQLAALVRAGIPILQAISMLRKRATAPRLRTVLARRRRTDSGWRRFIAGVCSAGANLSANLYSFDTGRRTIRRAR